MVDTYTERAAHYTNSVVQRLFGIIQRKNSNLCVAADLTRKTALLTLVDAVGPYICVLKTHIDILEDFDQEFIRRLQELQARHDFLIFEDRKFADIGNTVKLQYTSGIYKISSWADITNAHPLPGDGIVAGLKEGGLEKGRGLLLLAEMSSEGSMATGSYTESCISMAQRNKDFVIGFVAGRKVSDDDFLVFTPGVSLDTSRDSFGQQYRTPQQAIDSGSDVIIVGRGIYGAEDVVVEAKRYRDAGWAAYLAASLEK
ncbi:Orotidine 5'-phosphate decarboxylase [Neolecta irregularis DAH-3]|uniref:Orotidine 5'-phosphate decarboxylase n=1 Tax=Neolecta irregularis (strain DAH-3) TaxID=1198029 RepID=A0A1U7LQB8_NEOID|nr:Orotidine 5'-phosphate decarboxylase [Neolecta irregularis DAH-3]|eukprot:OLL24818.1 Orotidine 5'-phosphate decarboxylase [Neolecta irregularis DAH-3]